MGRVLLQYILLLAPLAIFAWWLVRRHRRQVAGEDPDGEFVQSVWYWFAIGALLVAFAGLMTWAAWDEEDLGGSGVAPPTIMQQQKQQ